MNTSHERMMIARHSISHAGAACALAGGLFAGNLVPNPGFEANSGCPTGLSQTVKAIPWTQPTLGTSDYYNTCGIGGAGVPVNWPGTQAPFAGNAYAGFGAYVAYIPEYREYLEVQLTSALVAGRTYEVDFWVSLADMSSWSCDSIGAYFQVGPVGPVFNSLPLLLTPQVVSPSGTPLDNKTGWTLVRGTFVAVGGEDHMVIGNFLDDAGTTLTDEPDGTDGSMYYYVDAVGVAEFVAPAIYCTGKVNSLGCVPAINFSGAPSPVATTGFTIGVSSVLSNKSGLLFYGTGGRVAAPFQGGTLCVMPPIKRTPVQVSGGNPGPSDCSGAFAFDFNSLIASGHDASLISGVTVNAQYWYRDPASASTTGLSDAIEFTIP